MSARGGNNQNKKAPRVVPSTSLANVSSATSMAVTKNRKRLPKKSQSQDSAELSMKTLEVSLEENTEAPFQTGPHEKEIEIVRPSTLYTLVKVEMPKEFSDLKKFNEMVSMNRNMAIDFLLPDFMTLFIIGDQIHEVNGILVNNKKQFETAFQKVIGLSTNILITVIRVWNIRCPSKQQLLSTTLEENYSYFITRVHRFFKTHGFTMKLYKRKMIVIADILPKSNGAFAFCITDRIIDIEGMNPSITQMQRPDMKAVRTFYNNSMKNVGYADCFCARPVSARSSPNPSVSGELSLLSNYGSQRPQIILISSVYEKRTDSDPYMEFDVVEIALREACRLKAITEEDSCPFIDKGRSLIKSGPCIEKSVYGIDPKTTSLTAKSRMKWRKPTRQSAIAIREQVETSKILSDVTEETELKKVDTRSGIVAYIRNAFTNS